MATMVHPGLFVGNGKDTYGFAGSVLHCAKDPWYLTAQQTLLRHNLDPGAAKRFFPVPNVIRMDYNQMALNMVDAESPVYFPDEMINAGLEFITERFAEGDCILCHCQLGLSRSPGIALLWMHEHGFLDDSWEHALLQFRKLYPAFAPGNGIFQYLKNRINKSS